ncbi:putative lipoprotein LppP [Mycobacterium marinum]|nr:putative lipoprotein LppP [Mycobacterium marinum]CDM77687.1 lipoprotein LppP [Mycobacterium marinum E11]
MHRHLRVILMILGLVLGLGAPGCGHKSAPRPTTAPDTCKNSDGPTSQTVRQAIAAVPVGVPNSTWVEIARGHTKNCRLYWVQIIPTIASESTPQQLLFFDHNTPLGSPTRNPKPYIRVLPSSQDTVTVQYQWRVGSDPQCCPTGSGTVRFQVGPDGKLKALGPIPHQ